MSFPNYTLDQVKQLAIQNGLLPETSSTSYNDQIGSQVQGTSFSSGVSNTSNTTQVIDGICEGPIEGWPTSDPMQHVYLDGTPVKSYNNTINTGDLRFEFKNGTTDQSPLSQYTIIGAVKSPNWLDEIDDINKIGGAGAIIQQVQIRDDTDGAYPPVEAVAFTFAFPEGLFRYKKSGGRDATPCGIKIELNNKADGSGTWVTKVYDLWNQEITSGNFEVTYIVEIPPGWATAAGLQEYATANFADDIVQFRISKFDSDLTGVGATPNERAHNKLYLKNYSIYTRNQFSFPYTALAGLTIDSRNFDGSVPQRMYDLKLLKVKVPSNYTTTVDPKTGKVIERKYTGVWDGTFKSALEWTDNPAWCFYDLVTNERYGLGKYIDPSLLNKWALYEIAKYCDAVETEGADQVFRIGTPTNPTPRGGVASGVGISAVKEPRFTCNLLIKDREEAYSVIQRMASLFRGIAYFQHGQLKVIQDKPGTPTYAFNNTNVVDGTFVYSSSSAKARHTVAIVRWLDPDDLYSEKLEYVEDYDGIARYGYREIELDGFGCTSKGQARRIGRHILITEKTELETVNFKTGMEGAILTVGSLIKIKDSLRQVKRAGGRIVSATSNTITVDASTEIPSGATNVLLWVETPTALDETIESNTYATYKPTLTSHTVTQAAGASYTSFTVSSPATFPTTPSAGNIWMLSYTPSGSTENNTVYKILAISENNSYEYEITAIQSQAAVAPYSNKYDAIEAYSPLPEYTPPNFKLFVPAPTEGWFSVSPATKGIYTVKLTWRMERNISGIKYKVAVKPSSGKPRVIANNILDTTLTYETTQRGIFYFYVYTLSYNGKQRSDPFVIGPVTIRDILPQNNFDVFNQTAFTAESITNTWDDDEYPNDTLAFELWKSSANSLRTAAVTNKTISSIDYVGKTITLTNFDQSTLTNSPDTYRVESPIYPYVRLKATNINKLGTTVSTSTTVIAIESHMKPDIGIGDKVFNATRSNNPNTSTNPKSSNVTAVTVTNPVPGTWFTQVTVSPAITGQVSGDIIYFYKGVVGVGLIQTQPSAAIKQKIVKAKAGTNTTTIVGATGVFTNVNTNDMVYNRTRGQNFVVTKVNNQTLTCTAISGQTTGDDIAIYQFPAREGRRLAKFKIDYLFRAWGGDAVILKDFFDADLLSQAKDMILVNLTRSKAAEIFSIQTSTTGIQISYWPSITGAADNDEVILIKKDEVFLSSINTYIHPTVTTCTVGTTSSVVVASAAGFFNTTVVGDILVNVRRKTSAVITNVNTGTNTVTLVGANVPDFVINGQVSGDGIFVVSAASIASSFNENLAYNHPTMYTGIAGTTTTAFVATNIVTNTGATSSYILYNATRNAYSAITSVSSPSTINLTTAITGQTTGDIVYVFLPSFVNTTTVTAPDGAFKHARPGDLFWNKTRNAISSILDVTTLTGIVDKKLDKIVLNSAIPSQAAGDEFIIFQGYYSGIPTAFTNNGSDDKITLKTLNGLNIGDQVSVYSMNATRVGITQANTITDTGLTPNTTYYYWMRVVNPSRPFITGPWRPTDTTGDSATTLPFGVVNYSGSNDTNASAITVPITGSTILGYKNKDSTYDVNIKWEWLGHAPTLDGFTLYFWSSGSAVDDFAVVNDEDYVKAQTGYSVPKNLGTKITACTITALASKSTTTNLVAGGTAVIVASTTGLVPGQKVTKTSGAGAFGAGSGLTLNTVTRAGELRRVGSIAAGGTGYNLGDIVSVAGGTGGTVRVTGTSAVVTATAAGTAVAVTATYTSLSPTNITATGSGLVVTVARTGGTSYATNTTITIVNGGSGYANGSTVKILGSLLGGVNGTNDLTLTVTSISSAVTAVTVHSVGSGYSNASNATTSFDITFSASNGPYITSIDSGTQFSVSVNHATSGAITFNCEQAVTVTTPTKGITIGDPIRITATQGLTNLNTTSTTGTTPGTHHYIVTNTTATTVTFDPTLTISGTYTANTGVLIPCKYSYTVNNITANYYFNAWGQPYRFVNSTIRENNIITGDVRMIYNG